jgi:hypothetical protein
MSERKIVGFVGVITLVSTIIIGIGAAPILLRPPISAEAKTSMSQVLAYSGKSFNGSIW